MIESLTPSLLVFLALAAFVTAILHSVGGFAGALLMSVAISPVIGVKMAVPLVSVAMVVSHGLRAFVFRNTVDWKIFALIFSVALPFILLGVYTYVGLSEASVGLCLGTVLLITLPLRRYLKNREIVVPKAVIAMVAVPYGFLSGASFGMGLLLGPFILGAGLSGEVLIATLAVQGFMLNLIKAIAFGISPLLGASEIALGIGMGLCTFPGHYIGRKLVRRSSKATHIKVLEAVMVIGALYFISRWFVV